jgi:hypothetical protein
MKSGLIVYLTGGGDLPENFDLAGYCRQLGAAADRVEVVGASQGFFDVQDAWHHLLTRGYVDIKLLVAQTEQDRLRPLHPLVRLSG